MPELNPAKAAFSLAEEFRNFAFKGNMIDLAVGVMIGAAFGKLIDSLVKHILMPLIGLMLPGGRGYLDWKLVVGEKEVPYGLFLGEVVNFVIVAAALFFFTVKFLGWVRRFRQHQESVAAPPPLTVDQKLLTEIRDVLRQQPEK